MSRRELAPAGACSSDGVVKVPSVKPKGTRARKTATPPTKAERFAAMMVEFHDLTSDLPDTHNAKILFAAAVEEVWMHDHEARHGARSVSRQASDERTRRLLAGPDEIRATEDIVMSARASAYAGADRVAIARGLLGRIRALKLADVDDRRFDGVSADDVAAWLAKHTEGKVSPSRGELSSFGILARIVLATQGKEAKGETLKRMVDQLGRFRRE
jgi:hypothetical protein